MRRLNTAINGVGASIMRAAVHMRMRVDMDMFAAERVDGTSGRYQR